MLYSYQYILTEFAVSINQRC